MTIEELVGDLRSMVRRGEARWDTEVGVRNPDVTPEAASAGSDPFYEVETVEVRGDRVVLMGEEWE